MKEHTYMFTSSLRIIAMFFTISISLTMLSMDPIVAKKKLSGYDRSELKKKNKNPLALSVMSSKNSLGCYFGTFSPDLLNNFLVCDLDSRGKNNFRQTTKLLSHLLCYEMPQDFMFQKGLNASKKDISDLIIKTLNTPGDIPAFKLNFIKEMSGQFIDKSVITESEVAHYSNKIIGLSETLEWTLICAENKYFNDFSINKMKIPSRSLIVACVTRDWMMLKQCLKGKCGDALSKNLRRIFHIIIQNNDIKCLNLVAKHCVLSMSSNGKREALLRLSPELVQLALFCGSDKLMHIIISWYREAKNMYDLAGYPGFKEENFFVNWIDMPVEVKDPTLYAIVSQYYQLLLKIHKNDLSKFYRCLKIICENNEFLKDISNNSAQNNTKKPILRRIINCSVM